VRVLDFSQDDDHAINALKPFLHHDRSRARIDVGRFIVSAAIRYDPVSAKEATPIA